jgi:hypothetical protein
MWEWLRRDRAYVEWYAKASIQTRQSAIPDQWGLHFC